MSEERLNTFRTFEKKMEDGSIDMIFDKLPEEAKTEIQRAHFEMVLNRDFKPIYVNVAPTAPVHNVKIDTEVKL